MQSTAMPTSEQHGFRPHSDGAFVPVQTRSERFRSTEVAEFAPVTGREHEWKYSPVAVFADLTSGELDGARVKVEAPDVTGVSLSWIPRDDARIGRAGTPEDRASANAWSSFDEALLVAVSGEESKTVTVTRSGLGTAPRGAHTVVEAAPDRADPVGRHDAGRLDPEVAVAVPVRHALSRDLQQVLVSNYGLDLTGWTLTSAYAISADGRTIVGSGSHYYGPEALTEAWIATIPEPSSMALLGLSAIYLFVLQRR